MPAQQSLTDSGFGSSLPLDPLWLGAGAIVVLALVWIVVRTRRGDAGLHALLGHLAGKQASAVFFLRGLFVPGNELFSRAPEDPRNPASGITVHKWGKIAELYSSADVLGVSELLQLFLASHSGLRFGLLSGELGRQAWSEDAIAIGPHYKSLQILDACEPKLVALRQQPAAFRSLVSTEVFEAKEGLAYGLVYKGQHPATHRTFWVVMGLDDFGTSAAAHFLRVHARSLGRLTGAGAFAAVIAIDTAKGWEASLLKSLQPRPAWWRLFLYRARWKVLTTNPWAGPTSVAKRPTSAEPVK